LRLIDGEKVALVGYSMGGFGALATAGAGYDPSSQSVKSLPRGLLDDQIDGRRTADSRLRALILIAPWGAQPPYRTWSAEGLQRLRLPTLFIAGEEDDISNYRDGIRWLYDRAVNADRRLLLYRSARHNVGGNPSPEGARSAFALREMFDEPVWRTDRLNAINQHFVTAFLDRHLKGNRTRDAILMPPAAGAEWPGFQKRWGLGFNLEAAPPR
jgi:pimeloyl-ACP methyl ester carboxylesterase